MTYEDSVLYEQAKKNSNGFMFLAHALIYRCRRCLNTVAAKSPDELPLKCHACQYGHEMDVKPDSKGIPHKERTRRVWQRVYQE